MASARFTHCQLCGRRSREISAALGVCAACIQRAPEAALAQIAPWQAAARREFGLPLAPPRREGGVRCPLCANECQIAEGERGFCGLRTVRDGHLVHLAGTPQRGLLSWYRDPLPTNCVADWVCEGSRQRGDHNLAVFYQSCTANCLFCQNWHFRQVHPERSALLSAAGLAAAANPRTFCVCFFGGDPASQMPHALAAAARLAARGVRVCWETNGMAHPRLMDKAMDYALRTGGCVKFDLKAWDEPLHRALTGVSNQRTLENFERAAWRSAERPSPPPLVASTLLVPGYVDVEQVRKLATFIASHDPEIPYALLGFAPNFYLHDLPCTSVAHAEAAAEAAREAGLMNVRIGNRHLLGWEYG